MLRTVVVPALAAALLVQASPQPAPAFALDVPDRMVTGRVALTARTTDPRVAFVAWTVDGTTRTTPPPFTLVLDVGSVPRERRIFATALDRERKPLYRQEEMLNAGELALRLEVLSPLADQKVSGSVPVLARVGVPRGDAVVSLTVDAGSGTVPLSGEGEVRSAVVEVGEQTTPVSVLLRTVEGRTAERTFVVNGRGIMTSSEAHIVEQMVAVTRGGAPLEGLTAADFRVRDDGGDCEVREVRLLRDTPLSVGLLVDTSQSLLYTEALRQAAAGLFLERTLKERDRAFLMRFGAAVAKVVDWTRAREALREAVLALADDPVAGTLLYSGLVRAFYQFQGRQGARALVVITDGNPYEDDTEESAALEYAHQAGVVVYALGLPSTAYRENWVKETDAEGKIVQRRVLSPFAVPPNLDALTPFAKATGGRVFEVRSEKDLPKYFAAIERDIRTQYLVSYVTNAKRKNAFHRVEIRAAGGRVRTAPGYFY